MDKTSAEHKTYEVEIEEDGRRFTGHITGRLIEESGDMTAYLTDDERVLLYDAGRLVVEQVNPEDLDPRMWPQLWHAVGLKPVIDR
jgi:hypothetical protein